MAQSCGVVDNMASGVDGDSLSSTNAGAEEDGAPAIVVTRLEAVAQETSYIYVRVLGRGAFGEAVLYRKIEVFNAVITWLFDIVNIDLN